MPVQLKDEIESALQKAIKSGSYMVAVWRVEDGRLELDRTTHNFPKTDLDEAVELLRENLSEAATT